MERVLPPIPEELSTQRLKNYHGEEWHTPRGRRIREVVFGINDGVITTIGFLAGVTGSAIPHSVVTLAGIVMVAAGAVSMAIGAFVSSKAQMEFFEQEIAREREEIETAPEKERQEVHEIVSEMGFLPDEAGMISRRITSDKNLWLSFMMKEELGIGALQFDNPLHLGLLIGFSFLLGGVPPLFPYIILDRPLTALGAAVLTSLLILFATGAIKTVVAKGHWWKSGLSMMGFGTAAAGIGFAAGLLIRSFIG